jgi:hypothetical protein
LHGGRREDRDEGVLDLRELLVQAGRDGRAGEILRLALVEGLEPHEHDARVGRVREPGDGEPGERDGVGDAFGFERELGHAANDVVGATQRGRVG